MYRFLRRARAFAVIVTAVIASPVLVACAGSSLNTTLDILEQQAADAGLATHINYGKAADGGGISQHPVARSEPWASTPQQVDSLVELLRDNAATARERGHSQLEVNVKFDYQGTRVQVFHVPQPDDAALLSTATGAGISAVNLGENSHLTFTIGPGGVEKLAQLEAQGIDTRLFYYDGAMVVIGKQEQFVPAGNLALALADAAPADTVTEVLLGDTQAAFARNTITLHVAEFDLEQLRDLLDLAPQSTLVAVRVGPRTGTEFESLAAVVGGRHPVPVKSPQEQALRDAVEAPAGAEG